VAPSQRRHQVPQGVIDTFPTQIYTPAACPTAPSPATVQHRNVDAPNADDQTTVWILGGTREKLQLSELELTSSKGPETSRQLLLAASRTSNGADVFSSGRYQRAGRSGQESVMGSALRRVGRAISASRPAAPDRWAGAGPFAITLIWACEQHVLLC
jgi:hypothetical protein